jgi:hypothetical protein
MRNLLTVLGIVLALHASCQDTVVIERKLDVLNRPKHFTNPYANFDVLKFMAGPGWATKNLPGRQLSYYFEFQFLYPVALLRDWKRFHIAYGVSLGHTAIATEGHDLVFADSRLIDISQEYNIERKVQKSRYIGIVLLPFLDIHNFHIMAGSSIRYNFHEVVKTKYQSGKDRKTDFTPGHLRSLSVPILFQLSYSGRQLLSWGLFGSFDTTPRFWGTNYRSVKHRAVGLSLGLRI